MPAKSANRANQIVKDDTLQGWGTDVERLKKAVSFRIRITLKSRRHLHRLSPFSRGSVNYIRPFFSERHVGKDQGVYTLSFVNINRNAVFLFIVVGVVNPFHKHFAVVDFICQRAFQQGFDLC